jgi:PII-like signaling protein
MERMMQLQQMAVLLRILIGDGDRFDGKPLYEAIVLKAREHGLAGATVLRGPMGFGHSSQVHTAKILRLSENLPVVVEIIDTKEQIDCFLPMLDEMMTGGLVSLEEVRILRYGSDRKEAASSPG